MTCLPIYFAGLATVPFLVVTLTVGWWVQTRGKR